jgi:hypothetical protein
MKDLDMSDVLADAVRMQETQYPTFQGGYLVTSREEAEDRARYEEWCAEQEARGELAGTPESMECYKCGYHARDMNEPYQTVNNEIGGYPFIMRKVVALGPIAEAHRDPTQTYKLECEHLAI